MLCASVAFILPDMKTTLAAAEIAALCCEEVFETTLVKCWTCESTVPVSGGTVTCCGRRYETSARGSEVLVRERLSGGKFRVPDFAWALRPFLTRVELKELPVPREAPRAARYPWSGT